MAILKVMQPDAGDWILPLLSFAACAKTERRDSLVLVLKAQATQAGEDQELSVRVPMSMRDGGALLDRLLELRASGVLPPLGAAA